MGRAHLRGTREWCLSSDSLELQVCQMKFLAFTLQLAVRTEKTCPGEGAGVAYTPEWVHSQSQTPAQPKQHPSCHLPSQTMPCTPPHLLWDLRSVTEPLCASVTA